MKEMKRDDIIYLNWYEILYSFLSKYIWWIFFSEKKKVFTAK